MPRQGQLVTDELRAQVQTQAGLTDARAAQIVAVRVTATGQVTFVTFDDGTTMTLR